MTKTQSLKAAPQHHCSTKTQELKPASLLHCDGQDAELETYVSAINAIPQTQSPKLMKLDTEFEARGSQASPQWQNVRSKARVSVITALITGSITAHVMRELTPIMRIFLGQFYPSPLKRDQDLGGES